MASLHTTIQGWFDARGWQVHPHQRDLLNASDAASNLLIAPTGGGKTLAGFLPSLNALAEGEHEGLHTIYVSPLKALAADIERNLQTPLAQMGLPIRVEQRTGDTSQTVRKRQRVDPPHILLTTPESLALLISYEDADRVFAGVQRVIIDEAHALADSKRGDQLMLALAHLQQHHPDLKRIGLSATVEDPRALGQFIASTGDTCNILNADPGPDPDISMLRSDATPPWASANALYAVPDVIREITAANTTLIFVNTRAQAEIFFHGLWQANVDNLPIGLHHGSLSKDARARVETAMIAGKLRAIVCTGSLDLGIDWGDVDLVMQIGAPKEVKRLVQRIGRSNHRYDQPSRAIIVPANRFEIIECQAALEAVRASDLDGEPRHNAPLDVLCQHILIIAARGAFDETALFDEVRSAGPYRALDRPTFDQCLDFCATGGYAFRAYDRWQRLMRLPDGSWRLRDPRQAAKIRMNIGTIVDTETLAVRMKHSRGGRPLGEVEEAFAATLEIGDTFLIGGQTVRYEGLREMVVQVTKQAAKKPKIAVFSGTKFATSTQLSARVIDRLNNPDQSMLPDHTRDWLDVQKQVSNLPQHGTLMVESFPRADQQYTCIYGFAGRNAHQTLGLLLTRRMEQQSLNPLGFVANDYALLIWGLDAVDDPAALLRPDGLRDGLHDWLGNNAVMKRSFRTIATIAGLIEKNSIGKRKSGRQATFSSDILYDTLRKYDPNHVLMTITKQQAMRGLVDFGRIEEMLERTKARVNHVRAAHLTPLAAPLLMEINKVPIKGKAEDILIETASATLMQAAGVQNLP